MKFPTQFVKYTLIAFLVLNSGSLLSMEYIKELKDNAQEFWSHANALTKTAVILGLGGASSYVLWNEWRLHQKNVHINNLENELVQNNLVTAALAYGGFNTSWDEIVCNLQNEEDKDDAHALFTGNYGLGDHHQKTYDLLTTKITEKVSGTLFYHVGSPGDLVNERLNDMERTLFGEKYTYQRVPFEQKEYKKFLSHRRELLRNELKKIEIIVE